MKNHGGSAGVGFGEGGSSGERFFHGGPRSFLPSTNGFGPLPGGFMACPAGVQQRLESDLIPLSAPAARKTLGDSAQNTSDLILHANRRNCEHEQCAKYCADRSLPLLPPRRTHSLGNAQPARRPAAERPPLNNAVPRSRVPAKRRRLAPQSPDKNAVGGAAALVCRKDADHVRSPDG